MRQATLQDVHFLTEGDLAADREDARGEHTYFDEWDEHAYTAHRVRIARFVTEPGHWALVSEQQGKPAGLFLGRLRQMNSSETDGISALASVLPEGTLFGEVFQLFVRPESRRLGMATALKREFESLARGEGAVLLYAHTRARNEHVLALNHALGYTEIYRGPLWDEVMRVSLVKWLQERAKEDAASQGAIRHR